MTDYYNENELKNRFEEENEMKTNSSYKYGCFHVGRTDMWGNYCPETGEYYLACPWGVLASVGFCNGEWQVQAEFGYSYEVVRELLQLGHLTSKTLALFIKKAGGEIWWDQPNYSKEI